MTEKKINIKNMVCPRCIMAVKDALDQHNIKYSVVNLGEVFLDQELIHNQKKALKDTMEKLGFELLNDKKSQIIEKIKNTIVHMVHHQNEPEKIGKLTEQLPEILGQSYSSLSKFFSEVEGITIERYLILQKIEKAKELLVYEELNISEIAFKLNYSSSQHFSRQFKEITGLTPTIFLQNKGGLRKTLDKI